MSVSLELAHTVVTRAHEHARASGAQIAVAVVDEGGHLRALGRMDGAAPLTAKIAEAKAVSVALFGRDGSVLRAMQADHPEFLAQVSDVAGRSILAGAGSVLIRVNGVVVGAMAVSGGGPDQDDDCAQAALTALPA